MGIYVVSEKTIFLEDLRLEENLCLSQRQEGMGITFPSEKQISRIRRCMEELKIQLRLKEYPKKLGSLERHLAEILRAYSMGCRILILNHIANRYTKEELEKLEYRSKKALEGKVRIMAIGEYDCCACCCTHVQKAGEIGMVKILSAQNYKGGTRLEIVCGMRALADYDEKTENAAAISEMLSVPTGKIAKATEALLKERDELKQIISRMKWEKINNIAEKVGETPKACVFAADFDSKDMVHLADTILDKTGGTAAVFAPAGTGYAFVLMSRTEDMRPMAAEMKEAFGSKGGGKPEAVQGRTEAKEKELKGFFAEKGYVMF